MTKVARRQIACMLWCGVLSGCMPAAPPKAAGDSPPPWFEDVTTQIGLDVTHDAGAVDDAYFMPQIIGSGAAIFDCDNDGRLDIYLLHNGGPGGARNRLFQQQPDGRFKDVSAGSGLDVAGYGMGVAVGDVNHDGRPDVYVSDYGGGRLFLNLGAGKFQEVKDSGIDNPMWGTACSFCDCNRDGWLDLVVVNYVDYDRTKPCTSASGHRDYCHPSTFNGAVTRLFRNRGCDKHGKWMGFEDQTDAAGLGRTPGPGLGLLCADLNGDGWPDIFVANDAKANHLWINQKNGTFKDEAVARGVAFNARAEPQGNMGVAYGDVTGSGMSDLFVTHLVSEHHSLWRQGPRGLFQDHAGAAGLTRLAWRGTGFGTVLADFNHDGALDLALVNGRVTRSGPPTRPFWDAYADRNQLLVNGGTGVFRDVSAANPALCEKRNVARGLAIGDLNGDGALDLLVTQVGGPTRVLRNVAPQRGHWLMVRAVDPEFKRDAYGAEVRVNTGSRKQHRLIQPSYSYLCSNDPRAHFGLGSADKVDPIEVLWPDGSVERFACPAVDRVVEVHRGKGERVDAK